jgi:hypothetical protein
MAYGLNLFNDQNQIMFSSENISYHFLGKYTAVSQGGTAITQYQLYANFTCNGTPLVFLDSNNGTIYCSTLQVINTGGNNWTAIVAGKQPGQPALLSLDIYVFAFPNNPSTSGYGIWCKNNAGQTTLNLEQRLLKLSSAFVTVAGSSATGILPSANLLFGSIPSNYIICSGSLGWKAVPAGASSLLTGLAPRANSTTSLDFDSQYVYASNAFPPNTNSYTFYGSQYIMIADKSLYI